LLEKEQRHEGWGRRELKKKRESPERRIVRETTRKSKRRRIIANAEHVSGGKKKVARPIGKGTGNGNLNHRNMSP